MRDHCETCRFFDQTEQREIGECTRYPPRIVSALVEADPTPDLDDVFYATLFPVVLGSFACGEHRRVESASGVPITRQPNRLSPGEIAVLGEGELPKPLRRAIVRAQERRS